MAGKIHTIAILVSILAHTAYGTTFFCDPANGNSQGNGSSQRPWRSIEEVLSARQGARGAEQLRAQHPVGHQPVCAGLPTRDARSQTYVPKGVNTDRHLNGRVANEDWKQMAPPVIDGPFVRPARKPIAQPVWGHAKGLQVGLYPMSGPRGLLRLYTPYLDYPIGRVINFIAIEPTTPRSPRRALSELEPSVLDAGAPGKRFWAVDDPADRTPRFPEERPARGVVTREDGVDFLRFFVQIERCRNGAHVYLRLTFRSDRPYEVGVALFAHNDSVPITTCIATATMGNFARLRELHLAGGKVVSSLDLWPDLKDGSFGIHKQFALSELHRTTSGAALVAATTNEAHPQNIYAPALPGWHYYGKTATQYWRCEHPDPELKVLVNGRFTYWARQNPVPGGVAYENFEMVAPFKAGQEFWFGVDTRPPRELGIKEPPGNQTP